MRGSLIEFAKGLAISIVVCVVVVYATYTTLWILAPLIWTAASWIAAAIVGYRIYAAHREKNILKRAFYIGLLVPVAFVALQMILPIYYLTEALLS